MTGKIRLLNPEKGFGFIKGKDNQDYFFHRSALKNVDFDELEVGQVVTFDDTVRDKGPRAENVTTGE